MLDVALVMLPSPNLSNPRMYYSLGILYIAANLRKHGVDVELVDLREVKPINLAGDLIPPTRFVGFSATTGEVDYACLLARDLRNGAKAIVGGPHATLVPEEIHLFFDATVAGEGEVIMVDIAKDAVRLKENTFPILKPPTINDLDTLPFPAWDMLQEPFSESLFPGEKYGRGEKAATILGSRGCPFACAFCGNMFSRQVRYRSPENIAYEVMKLRQQYGIQHLRFEDDNITLNRRWLLGLCRELKALDVKFKCHTRADLVDDERLAALVDAGCVELAVALESADDRLLKLHKKGVTAAQVGAALQKVKVHGMIAKTYLIAGLPGETEASIELTKQWYSQYRPDKWTLSRFTPYPGSEVWRNPAHFGITWMSGYMAKYWNFYEDPPYRLKGCTKDDLNRRYKELYSWLVAQSSNMASSVSPVKSVLT